ncbi:heterokaryon incompatibility protein-domain-containing protein [Cercophora samala]|uniref:Heterokaryon incompatibility protein-domain-containing protein n=1 Tax=Cercophora samala TaxID=330535 RepID=A0AA39ZF33_9PEZI|nr:heterokaryon incompatibility protein-domain-containing protein [Cercophora samala]
MVLPHGSTNRPTGIMECDSFCPGCYDLFQIPTWLPVISTDRPHKRSVAIEAEKWETIRRLCPDCLICQKFYTSLEDNYSQPSTYFMDQKPNHSLFAEFCLDISSRVNEYGRVALIRWSFPSIHMNTPPSLAVWANSGSPACAVLVSRPPLSKYTPNTIGHFIAELLEECSSHHGSGCCPPNASHSKNNATEEEVDLPTRLLSILKEDTGLRVKLVETSGSKGRYFALSHTWGPPEKRPLCTTRKTFAKMRAGIPDSDLPATFREAVRVTHASGVSFIWIDSLCIIQDDDEDWKTQAAAMAAVYRNASLVIAAAASDDSTRGLCLVNTHQPVVYRFPYRTAQGTIDGCYYLAPLPNGPLRTEETIQGPLRSRAWAFQEWYLATRIVLFTTYGIYWKCARFEMDERGVHTDLLIYERFSWFYLLEEYSQKSITRPTDRLVALQGIISVEQERRNDRYLGLGVWEHDLAQQLLWRRQEDVPPDSYIAQYPSWCWAATGGAKFWLMDDIENTASAFSPTTLTDRGCIVLKAKLLRVGVISALILKCCYDSIDPHDDYDACLEERILPWLTSLPWESLKSQGLHLITNPLQANSILGIANFDHAQRTSEALCLILGSSDRLADDPCFDDGTLEEDGNEDGNGSQEGDSMRQLHADTPDCVDFRSVGRSKRVYWALLVEPIQPESLKRFKRVGVAMLYPHAMKPADLESMEYELV